MLLFVAAEAMLFAGMISAFTIIRSSAVLWPPLGQPRLPVAETAVNTAALLLSGVLLYLAQRAYARDPSRALRPLGLAVLLGGFFVLFQGVEWVALVGEGLTITSSTHGELLLPDRRDARAARGGGARAPHRTPGCGSGRAGASQSQLAAAQVFWYFVVGLWPILYLVVYL